MKVDGRKESTYSVVVMSANDCAFTIADSADLDRDVVTRLSITWRELTIKSMSRLTYEEFYSHLQYGKM
jgi:hypothetical protein